MTLPNSTGFAARILVKRMGSGAVTIQGPAGIQIDGQASYSLSAQYKFVELLADRTGNWAIIGAN